MEINLQNEALLKLALDSNWKLYSRNRRLLILNTKHYTSKRPPFCANDFNFHRSVEGCNVVRCYVEALKGNERYQRTFPPSTPQSVSHFSQENYFSSFRLQFQGGRSCECLVCTAARVCQLIEKKCFRSIFPEMPSSIAKCGFEQRLGLREKSLIKE